LKATDKIPDQKPFLTILINNPLKTKVRIGVLAQLSFFKMLKKKLFYQKSFESIKIRKSK
jgi:hypothetical protein